MPRWVGASQTAAACVRGGRGNGPRSQRRSKENSRLGGRGLVKIERVTASPLLRHLLGGRQQGRVLASYAFRVMAFVWTLWMLYLRFGSFLSNDVSSWKLVFDPLSIVPIALEDNIWLLPCIIETTGERRMRLLVMTGTLEG